MMVKSLLFLLMASIAPFSGALAQQTGQSFEDHASLVTRQLDSVERALPAGKKNVDDLARLVMDARSQAGVCIKGTEEELAHITGDQALLGQAVAGEDASVAEKREVLRDQRLEAERRLSSCRLLVLRSDDLSEQISQLQKQQLRQTLFARGPDAWTLLRENWTQPAVWFNATTEFLYTSSGLELLSTWEYAVLAILATIAFVLSLNLRKRARKWAGQRVAEASFTSRFSIAFLSVFGRYAPHWITSSVVAICLYLLTLGI